MLNKILAEYFYVRNMSGGEFESTNINKLRNCTLLKWLLFKQTFHICTKRSKHEVVQTDT